jgi:hypothetical protein
VPPRTWITVPAVACFTACSSWAAALTVTVVEAACAPPVDSPR